MALGLVKLETDVLSYSYPPCCISRKEARVRLPLWVIERTPRCTSIMMTLTVQLTSRRIQYKAYFSAISVLLIILLAPLLSFVVFIVAIVIVSLLVMVVVVAVSFTTIVCNS